MSKFACKCGNVISDVVCPNEVTGSVLSDKSEEKFFDDLSSIIADCLELNARGKIGEWMQKHFNKIYPANLPVQDMLHDVLSSRFRDLKLAVLECDQCRRLWIQRKVGENRYREYVPASQDGFKVLGFNQQIEQS